MVRYNKNHYKLYIACYTHRCYTPHRWKKNGKKKCSYGIWATNLLNHLTTTTTTTLKKVTSTPSSNVWNWLFLLYFLLLVDLINLLSLVFSCLFSVHGKMTCCYGTGRKERWYLPTSEMRSKLLIYFPWWRHLRWKLCVFLR